MKRLSSPRRPLPTPRVQGFTLIELLVVIAIIAILAAIFVPSYAAAQKRPNDVAALQCGKAIVAGQITYMAEHNGVPAGSLAQLGNADAVEQCQNIQLIQDGPTITQGSAGNNNIAVGGTNYAFRVWSNNGSAIYAYNRDGNVKFVKQN
ncbi:prepilin-type N-terminal cleavage/methylation domain-containing protein [Deinococcus sp. KNUC1210]|uniref:prepilin-type N-terminal cleavage/methylation domain-containing protein n=1 Tax=Deinococcus sp. KNUC1210 TaxID=2917691 RepID=UPI0027149881|nr:prepilin-type N-terminal cleavage/methylation domain-containing protein [Deinococcus sp. KNUC1210]